MQITDISDEKRTVDSDAPPAKGSGSGGSGSGGSGSGGGYGSSAPNFTALEKEWKAELKNLQLQIDIASYEEDWETVMGLYDDVRSLIAKAVKSYTSAGYSADSTEVLTWVKKDYTYADKQSALSEKLWDKLTAAIEDLADAAEQAEDLAEKQQAVTDAKSALSRAEEQRSVRVWNEESGQWEWIADESRVTSAQSALETAETQLRQERIKQELEELKSSGGNIEDTAVGGTISEILSSYDSADLQELADALGLYSSLAEMAAGGDITEYYSGPAQSVTNYYFPGGITFTAQEAEGLTLAELAAQLEALGVTGT